MSESKLDLTKPIQTEDGRKAEFLMTMKGDHLRPNVFVITEQDGTENLRFYTPEGKSGFDYKSNLINAPEKRTMWLYEMPVGYISTIESERNNYLYKVCISRIKIEFESGRKDE